jgi:hypothetical protein
MATMTDAEIDRRAEALRRMEAQARLVAHAPALLIVLKDILHSWDHGALTDMMFSPIATARAIVAKIEGQS